MYGMDISKWQGNLDLTKGNYDFCIVKASEGSGYIDGTFSNRIVQLTELGKLIGTYHFARPDLHKTESKMIEEAKWYMDCLNKHNLIGRSIMVLDWEKEPYNNESLVAAFLYEIYNKTRIKPFIYGSRSKLTKWKDWKIMKEFPIWMAMWPSIERIEIGKCPNFTNPISSEIPWLIWQYSSTGIYPEYNGNVDADYTLLTADAWKLHCIPEYIEEKPEQINQYMQWAIDNGLFVGDGNGNYRPTDPLTREEAATLFYQFYNKFIK